MVDAASAFDDYLRLGDARLSGTRVLVLRGRSGSGKSTYLRWLVGTHPDVAKAHAAGELATLDEVLDASGLPALWRAARSSRMTVAASHLPGWAHVPLRALGPLRVLDLDRPLVKLRGWLEARGIPSSERSLASFRRRFGGSYTDLAIVIERYPGLDFDRAWARFDRECRVRTRRVGTASDAASAVEPGSRPARASI